jgi:DNA-binding CsgD family transcriptional regulator
LTKALEHFVFGVMAMAFPHVETSGFLAPQDDSLALKLLQAHQGDFEHIIYAQTADGPFKQAGNGNEKADHFPTIVYDQLGSGDSSESKFYEGEFDGIDLPFTSLFEPGPLQRHTIGSAGSGGTKSSGILAAMERDVLQMIAEGFSPEGSAMKLGLTEADFDRLMDSAVRKLGAQNRLHAVTLAVLNGYISIGPEIPDESKGR